MIPDWLGVPLAYAIFIVQESIYRMQRLGTIVVRVLEWLGKWGWVILFVALCLAALVVFIGDVQIVHTP